MRPLALIAPDPELLRRLQSTVESAGYRAECFQRGIDAAAELRTRTFALVLIDLGLTDTDPYALCRDASPRVPVMAFSRQCSTETCVRALESGADDCVRATVTGRELIARVRNVLQRAPEPPAGGESLEHSVITMHVRNGELSFDLTRGESELLGLLLRHAPMPLTVPRMAQLLESKRTTIESRIKSLRRKIGARLVARGGFGYAIEEPEACRNAGSRDPLVETDAH